MTVLLFVLAGILGLFVAVDVLGHRALKLARGIGGWALVAALAVGCIGSAALGVSQLVRENDSAKGEMYLAYRYLEDGEGQAARAKAALCKRQDGQLIALLADAVERDYFNAYFTAQQLLEKDALSVEGAQVARKVRQLAGSALGLSLDETTGKLLTATGEALPLVGLAENEAPPPAPMTEEERHNQLLDIVHSLVIAQDIPLSQAARLDEMYSVELALATGRVDTLAESEMQQLLAQHQGDADVQLLGVRYYVQRDDYETARKMAHHLLEQDASVENYVIYTDIIAQQALDRGYSADAETDPEAAELLKRADRLEQKAAAMDTSSSYNRQKYEEVMAEVRDLRDSAARLDVARAINYLQAKKPLFGDSTGMLDMQIAKMYVALDDRESAQEYVWRVVDKADTLPESSPLAQPMQQVVTAWDKTDGSQESPGLSRAVRAAVQAQSSNVVPLGTGSVNDTMADYVTSTLKYDRVQVFISSIDTENYPTVRAYVNISGEKDGAFGRASDFDEGDFEVYDTQYPITDFKLLKDDANRNVNIALVLDVSGSMDGTPLKNARLAAESCVTQMDAATQRMSVVGYSGDGAVVVNMTDSVTSLTDGIRGLNSGGGTNIPAGIHAGLSTLTGQKGVRAMILLTDGQDGNAGEMPAALQAARDAGVAIYTVGLGDVDSAYLRDIADTTGGKYIAAANATELSNIYLMLQKYIVNNYCFEYTVTANPKRDPRRLTIYMSDYGSYDERAYRVADGETAEDDTETEARVLEENEIVLQGFTPGGVGKGDLKKGISVTVTGRGFTDGITVRAGSLTVTNLKIVDENTATGTLKGTLEPGSYDVRLTDADGRVELLFGGLRVFKAGVVSSVQLGNMLVLADVIGGVEENDDGSYTKLAASGNVSINGFLHSSGELMILPSTPVKGSALDNAADGEALYLGTGGSIEGNGKLYVSYAQTAAVAGDGLLGDYFTQAIMGGKDLVVRKGDFGVKVGESTSTFGSRYDQPVADAMRDYTIDLPGMSKMFATTVTLYADRLQLDSDLLNIGDIEDNLISGLTGGAWGAKKDKEALEKDLGDWGSIKGSGGQGKAGVKTYEIDGKLSVAVGADAMRVGGEVSLKLESTKKFVLFPLKGLTVKVNSLDPQYEYWKFGVKFLLPGVEVMNNSMTLDASLSSYLWYPDALNVDSELDPGIPMFKVMNLTKVGGGFTGLSRIWTDENTPQGQQDITLRARAEADVNLFKMLNMPTTGAMKSISRWGEMGKIANAEAVLNISDASIYISADLELLQQKVANAMVGISTQKLAVEGKVGTTVSAAGIRLSGNLSPTVKVQWLGNQAGGVSALLHVKVDGSLAVDWAGINETGQGGLELDADLGARNGTMISAKVYVNDSWARAWYDSEGRHLWDKFHFEGEL